MQQGFHVLLTSLLALLCEYNIRDNLAAAARHDAHLKEMLVMTQVTEDVNQKIRDQMLANCTQDIRDDEAKRKAEEFKTKACDPQG